MNVKETGPKTYTYDPMDRTVVGEPIHHVVGAEETLLDIAREYGLGYNEVKLMCPGVDPWLPPVGETLTIPSFWVLPDRPIDGIVVNVPELRLYYFDKRALQVQTYPISIGSEELETPLGTFQITEKRVNPTWYVPKSIQEESGMKSMAPGPDNPLGEYAMRLSDGSYIVHGTNAPWGVGRLVSHGCIRLYPEHMRLLYPQVAVGTKVRIVYEPIKFGQKDGRFFAEVHPDVYGRYVDFKQYADEMLNKYPLAACVDKGHYDSAVDLQSGLPTDVTALSEACTKAISDKAATLSAHNETIDDVGPLEAIQAPEPPENDITGEYAILVASFRDQDNAENLFKELKGKGYHCCKQTVESGQSGRWHRVKVGNFNTYPEAARFGDQFNDKEGSKGIVIKSPCPSE